VGAVGAQLGTALPRDGGQHPSQHPAYMLYISERLWAAAAVSASPFPVAKLTCAPLSRLSWGAEYPALTHSSAGNGSEAKSGHVLWGHQGLWISLLPAIGLPKR